VVPAVDTKRKTKRYLIAWDDAKEYLRRRSDNPIQFISGNQRNIYVYDDFKEFNQETAIKLRRIAEVAWIDQPDVLQVRDISDLLGYRAETIYRWRKNLGLNGCIISGKLCIPKIFLLDFIATPEFHKIQRKTIQHLNLLRRAIHAGE